jgi:hypothetical protein
MYHPVEADADHFHRLEQRNGVWSLGTEIGEREPASEYQITHHDLQVRLLPAEHRLNATDRMTVRRLRGAHGLMLARMSEDFAVQEVRVAGAVASFGRAGGLLAVAMPLGPPASLLVQVEYGGIVHHPGMDDVNSEVSLLFSYWYPNIARLPATGDVTVTAPAAWTVIAEGEQQDRTATGDEARTRWRQTHPVCWLQIAAGPYQRTSRAVGDKTLNVYLLKPNPGTAETALNTVSQALPFFSRTFTPFPWTHYDVVEYPMSVGALEGYSMTAMSLELLRVALPHELSHSWWGGLVPNTYTVDMWNEGFASYSERLLSEAAKPEPRPGLHAGDKRPRGPRLPPRLPIIGAGDALDEPQAMVGYKKGAAVLHMFRRTVGDETFHRVMARFATEMAGHAATWRDFQRVAEEVTGREMGWFFDPWLTRTDAPRLRWGPARQEGGTLEAEIDLANPAYRLRLPVAIDTADGRRRIEEVEVAGPRTHIKAALRMRAIRLVLDPGADFLLERAEQRPDPWTLELGSESAGRTTSLVPAVPPVLRTGGRQEENRIRTSINRGVKANWPRLLRERSDGIGQQLKELAVKPIIGENASPGLKPRSVRQRNPPAWVRSLKL